MINEIYVTVIHKGYNVEINTCGREGMRIVLRNNINDYWEEDTIPMELLDQMSPEVMDFTVSRVIENLTTLMDLKNLIRNT